VYPSYADEAYRIHFFCDEIEEIELWHQEFSSTWENLKDLLFIPNMFVTSPDVLQNAIWEINKI
jgi:excinuclease ABC subunit B